MFSRRLHEFCLPNCGSTPTKPLHHWKASVRPFRTGSEVMDFSQAPWRQPHPKDGTGCPNCPQRLGAPSQLTPPNASEDIKGLSSSNEAPEFPFPHSPPPVLVPDSGLFLRRALNNIQHLATPLWPKNRQLRIYCLNYELFIFPFSKRTLTDPDCLLNPAFIVMFWLFSAEVCSVWQRHGLWSMQGVGSFSLYVTYDFILHQ